MLFSLGHIHITPAAAQLLTAQQADDLLARHLNGDWGQLGHYNDTLPTLTDRERHFGHSETEELDRLNCISVIRGYGRVTSHYPAGGQTISISTAGGPPNAHTVIGIADG